MRTFIIQTPEFRLAWPNLDKPYAFPQDGTPYWGTTALFEDGEVPAQLARLCQLTAEDYFGAKKAHAVRMPFREGKNYGEGRPNYSNFMTANLKTKVKPLMRVLDEGDGVYLARPGDFYPGVYACAELMAYAFDRFGHRGVGLHLLSITRTREMELTPEQASLIALTEAAVDPLLDL